MRMRACVCPVYACVCARVSSVCMYMCPVGGPRCTWSLFLDCPPLYLRQGLSWDLELIDPAALPSELPRSSCLWVTSVGLPSVLCTCLFMWALGTQTQVLVVTWQVGQCLLLL